MPLVTTSELVASAVASGTAVMAFNVITVEHAEGVSEGVERAGAAALIQLSENTVLFHGGRIAPLLAACAQIATHSSVPLAIHLDHFQNVDLVMTRRTRNLAILCVVWGPSRQLPTS